MCRHLSVLYKLTQLTLAKSESEFKRDPQVFLLDLTPVHHTTYSVRLTSLPFRSCYEPHLNNPTHPCSRGWTMTRTRLAIPGNHTPLNSLELAAKTLEG